MDQTAPAEITASKAPLRRAVFIIGLGFGLTLMLVWSVVLPLLGILYLVKLFI